MNLSLVLLVRKAVLTRVPIVALPRPNGLTMVTFALVTAVLSVGLYIRVAAIHRLPFNEDEYATALQTIGIMETWKPTLPSGSVQRGEPVFIPYVMSLLWRVTGPDIMAGRLLSVAVSMASILLAYLLGRRLHGRVVGLIFAFLIATNLWSIASGAFFRSYALAELAFLVICYVAVVWLQNRRSFKSYLVLLGGSSIIAMAGHYLLTLAIPAVAVVPVIAKVSDTVGKRIAIQPLESRQGAEVRLVHIQWDTTMTVLLLSLALAFSLGSWVLFQHGVLLAKVIGKVTGEFFSVLPADPRITFRPFFLQSLEKLYGPQIMFLIGAGVVVMVAKSGRLGLAILLYYVIPFMFFSTVFASLTVTSLFDRYIFPYNPALLLALAFLMVWIGENLVPLLSQMLPRVVRLGKPGIDTAITTLLVLGLVVLSPAFVLRFDQNATLSSIDSWVRGRGEPKTPSYHLASGYIKQQMMAGDVVVSSRPWNLPFELPDTEGYWLMGAPLELAEAGIRIQDKVINRYTGYPAVSTLSQFLDLITEKPVGWVVVPYFHDSPGVLTRGVWDFIHNHMTLVPEVSDNTIQVFRWGPRNLQVMSLAQVPQPYGTAYDATSLGNGAVSFKGRPGSVDWGGVQYNLDAPMRAADVIFDLQIKVDQLVGAGMMRFNFILEEQDGDRWHVPSYSPGGYLAIETLGQWYRFVLGFGDFSFWPLGQNTKEPEHIQAIRLEGVNTRNLTFSAQTKVNLLTTKAVEGGSP